MRLRLHRRLRAGEASMSRWPAALGLVVAWWCLACIATPLPTPPTADPDRITIVDAEGGVRIQGEPGAIGPSPADVRITWEPPPTASARPERVETTTTREGAFTAHLSGDRTSRYYLELLTADDDLFLVTITGGPGDSAVMVDSGSDRDGDGSPDFVDCAPDDPSLRGQRCP
jgi:hypothetical protein